MSAEAVKKQIILAAGDLTLPLDCHLPKYKINAACAAAKLLRNRLLREHSRVLQNVEAIRQQQLFDEGEVGENELAEEELKGTGREEFLFIAELMVLEKLALPLLLAHGLSYPDTLLSQLLKLITAMLLPVPRFSVMETVQKDILAKLKRRCGTDEHMAFLVQVVAPIAQKRKSGETMREDVVLLEVVLKLLSLLLRGSNENVTGAFCRNHGFEMLLVVLNQNYAKTCEEVQRHEWEVKKEEEPRVEQELYPPSSSSWRPELEDASVGNSSDRDALVLNEEVMNAEKEDETEDDELVIVDERAQDAEAKLTARFEEEVHRLLEGEEQLWKWNKLILECIASVFATAPGEELAALGTMLQSSNGAVNTISVRRNAEVFQACQKEREKWLHLARSRNGALASNALLIRRDNSSARRENHPGSSSVVAVGTVSTLVGSRLSDPLDAIRVMDTRKRGKFVRGMFQGSTPKCTLHIHTQLELAKQCQSFFLFGFEPLSSMVWGKLQSITRTLEEAAKSYSETRSGYKQSGERMDISSPFDAAMYESLNTILSYMSIGSTFLRYMREVARNMLETANVPSASMTHFQQLWQSLSNIISLGHLTQAFTVLKFYLSCKDIGRRTDISVVIVFLTELLLAIELLVEGRVLPDPTVQTAAHALASSVLYREDTIKCLFDVLGSVTSFAMDVGQARTLTLFTFAIFQLMEQCSFSGTLFVPKTQRKRTARNRVTDTTPADPPSPSTAGRLETSSKEIKEEEGDDAEWEPATPPRTLNLEDEADRQKRVRESQTSEEDEEEGEVQRRGRKSVSEAPSHTSDLYSTSSCAASEKEIAVSSVLDRLSTPKFIWLLVVTLRHWRTNEADVNLALVHLMKGIVRNGHSCVFFSLPFLLSLREVVAYGKDTHTPLYRVCDQLVFEFFNPPHAHCQDELVMEERAKQLLSGAQSYLGFEVALRCARSLFTLSPVEYTILEEKGIPHRLKQTSLPLRATSEEKQEGDALEDVMRSPSLEQLLTAEPVGFHSEETTPEKAADTSPPSNRQQALDGADRSHSPSPKRRRRHTKTHKKNAVEVHKAKLITRRRNKKDASDWENSGQPHSETGAEVQWRDGAEEHLSGLSPQAAVVQVMEKQQHEEEELALLLGIMNN